MPRKITTVQVTKKVAIGKPTKRRNTKNSTYHMKAAKDLLYGELGNLFVKKEKATKKTEKKKISKQITEKKRQINKLK